MQIKTQLNRMEALRRGLVEANEWPQHFGGRPDLIGFYPLDMASAPLDGVGPLVAALSTRPDTHMAFGRGRCLLGRTLATTTNLLLGTPLGLRATLGAALFRTGFEFSGAICTPFHHERLAVFELVWRYQRLLTCRTPAAAEPSPALACAFDVATEGWREHGHADSSPRWWSRPPTLMECVGVLRGLLYLRLLLWLQRWTGNERAARKALQLGGVLLLAVAVASVARVVLVRWAALESLSPLGKQSPPPQIPSHPGRWWRHGWRRGGKRRA